MLRKFPALRRILIYGILSYIALVVVNNSGYELENMWLIYAPMFIAVYVFSRWVDSRLPNDAAHERQKSGKEDWSINILRFTKAITTLTSIKLTKNDPKTVASDQIPLNIKATFQPCRTSDPQAAPISRYKSTGKESTNYNWKIIFISPAPKKHTINSDISCEIILYPKYYEFGIGPTGYIHNFIKTPPDRPQSQNKARDSSLILWYGLCFWACWREPWAWYKWRPWRSTQAIL